MKEYIEREAVLNLLEKINPVDFGSMFDYSSHGAVNECLHDARYGVESLPADDVAEVRHGRWESNGPDDIVVYCSQCMMPQDAPSNYCSSCGALMDKEGEHEQID